MKNLFLSVFFFFCSIQVFYSQKEDGAVSFVIPPGNSLKFNSFTINPTFSFVRQQSAYITLFNKTQWAGFENAPKTYLLSYSGRFKENEGIALGVFKQDYGVLTTFGLMTNFAHNIILQEDNNLTFGINLGAYKSGLNNGKIVSNFPDPSLDNIPSNTLLAISPGVNYGTTYFDFGLAYNNLVTYNFNSGLLKDDPNSGIEAHVMYTGFLDSYGFFDKSKFSALIKTELYKEQTVISGSAMFAIPKGVWAQAGYNSVLGISAGLGLNITPKIALEYSYGMGLGDISNLGASHIIVLAYKLKNNNYDYGDDEEEGAIFTPDEVRKTVPAKAKTDTKEVAAAKSQAVAEAKAKLAAAAKTKADAQKAAAEKAKLAADAKAKSDAEAIIAKNKLAADAKAKSDASAAQIAANKKSDAAATKAKLAADAKAKADADASVKLAADAKAKSDAQAKLAADTKAKADATAQAKLAADAKAKSDAEAKAKLAADAKAKADAQAKLIADSKIKADADAQAALATKAKAEAEAKEAQAKLAADAKAKADAQAKLIADSKIKADADAQAALATKAKAEAEAKEAQAKLAADAKAKADAQAKLIADSKIKADAGAQAALATKAKAEAEAKEAQAKLAAEAKAKADADAAQAKLAAEAKAKADADAAQAKLAAEAKAKADADAAQAKLAAEAKVKADATAAQAKLAADAKAKADAEAQAKLAAEAKAKADAAAQAKLAAETKAKADAEAQAKLAAEAKAKADADAAQAKLAAEAKAKADAEAAQAKLAAEAKAKADAEAQAKLAAEAKVKADADAAQAKLAAEAKAKADADAAQAKLAAEAKAKADAAAQAKLAAEAKAKADAEAQAKLAAEAKAKADADAAQAKLVAEAKAKADAAAQAKLAAEAKAKADADAAQAKLAAEAKAKADAAAEQDRLEAAAAAKLAVDALAKAKADAMPKDEYGKSMDNLTKVLEDSKKKQQQLLTRLDASVANKQKALKELKEENDLSDKGIVKTTVEFKSTSGENAELEAIRTQIAEVNRAQNESLAEFNRLYNERLKKVPNKNDLINQNYLKTIESLKAEQAKAEESNAALIRNLEQIKIQTEIEKKRRIKRAASLNDQDRYAQDLATLKRLKETTKVSATPLKVEDFDFGDSQSNMQIIKNNKNVESGYYLIIAVHNDVQKRDTFVTKTISAGQKDVNFFYDANSSKYFIYDAKFDNLEEATQALESKGSKPYNSKMVIVKIEK